MTFPTTFYEFMQTWKTRRILSAFRNDRNVSNFRVDPCTTSFMVIQTRQFDSRDSSTTNTNSSYLPQQPYIQCLCWYSDAS